MNSLTKLSAFVAAVAAGGGTVVTKQTYPADTKSFAAAAAQLEGKWDGVFIPEQAETLARQNIVQSTTPKPSDWILLGDAQSKLGRAVEANDSYAKALSVVSQKISKRSSSDPVAAEASTAQPLNHR